MLTPRHCDVFKQPFFQFAQWKKYQPEHIPQLKSDYKTAWQDWQRLIVQTAEALGGGLAAPHIERWCNGWQVRAHFFAFFKYAQHNDAAVILSVLLNRRRLTASLSWHTYKAAQSSVPLAHYHRWVDAFAHGSGHYADFEVWHADDSEYADHPRAGSLTAEDWALRYDGDFLTIGRHIDRDALARTDSADWLAQTVRELLPLYEAVFADG